VLWTIYLLPKYTCPTKIEYIIYLNPIFEKNNISHVARTWKNVNLRHVNYTLYFIHTLEYMQDIFILERGYVHCCQWGVLGKDKNLANDPQEFLGLNSRCPCTTLCNIFGHGATPCKGYTQCLCNTVNIHRQVLQNSLPKKILRHGNKVW